MENENKASIVKIVANVFQSVFKLFRDITILASAEARLARASAANLIIMVFVLGALLTCTWLTLLGLLIAYLLSIKISLVFALASAVVINLFLLMIVLLIMLKLKSNLFFPATRKQISRTKKIIKETYRERITKKD
jgi:hypothetical protein